MVVHLLISEKLQHIRTLTGSKLVIKHVKRPYTRKTQGRRQYSNKIKQRYTHAHLTKNFPPSSNWESYLLSHVRRVLPADTIRVIYNTMVHAQYIVHFIRNQNI